MEYKVGQELYYGPDVSAVIFHVNDQQVTAVNWDGAIKYYQKEKLDKWVEFQRRLTESGKDSEIFKIVDEPSELLKDTHVKAQEYIRLMEMFPLKAEA